MSASPNPHASSSSSSSATASTSFAPPRKGAAPVTKPINVFTNDGSFLDRFKTSVGDKVKADEALSRKKVADDRFKNRGKRTAVKIAEDDAEGDDSATKAKKSKMDTSAVAELTAYQKEVAKLSSRSLKDEGFGTRSILK